MLLTKVQIHYLHLGYLYYLYMVCAHLPEIGNMLGDKLVVRVT